MTKSERRQFSMLTRVHEFGVAHAELFPDTQVAGQMFATVARSVDELNERATTEVAREGASRRDVPKKTVARGAVRAQMVTISRTARALALDTPGLDDQFRIPAGRSDQSLLAAARAFAREVGPLAAAFIAHGLPETCVAQLEASIEAFATALREHAVSQEEHAAARAAIEQGLDAGRAAVQRLEAIVPNYIGDDQAIAAMWERARHVEHGRRTKAAVEKPAAPQPAVAAPAAS